MAKKIKQAVKHTGKARKEIIVAKLVEKIDASNGLVFTDYKGLTHQQLENLKKDLKTMDSTIVIAKNSLLRLGLGQSKNFGEFKDNEALELPTATLFIKGDMVEPLKRLQKTIKEFGLPKVKFAILEGNLVDESGVAKIAALPSREILIAQFVGTLNSPIQGFVTTLNATIQKFVMTLDAVASTKQNSTPQTKETASETTETATPATQNSTTPDEQSNDSKTSEEPAETAEVESQNAEEKPTEEPKTDETNEGGEK